MKYHKDPIALVIGLREKMQILEMNHTQLGRLLDLVPDHVRRLSGRTCGASVQVLAKLVKLFGPIQVEIEGLRYEFRQPVEEEQAIHDLAVSVAEAGWISKEESDEAEELIPRLITALKANDVEALVYLYEQIICDPQHASKLLETSFARATSELFYVIKERAKCHHIEKISAKVA